MPKLSRETQKVYGENAAPRDLVVIGSLAAGNPQTASTLEEMQSSPRFEEGVRGSVLGNNNPALQDRGTLDYILTRQIAYILQTGLPEWDPKTTYYKSSFVNGGNGSFYISLVDDNKGNPVTDETKWQAGPSPEEIASKVSKAGDTMTGQLVMNDTSGGIKLEGSVVPNPAGVDADTLAVWHFDGTQADVIAGLLFNNNYPTPAFDTGIYKFGTASLQYRDSNVNPFYSSPLFTDRNWTATDWTIDGWVFYKNSNSRMLLGPISGSSTVSGTGLRINASNLFVYVNSDILHILSTPFQDNSWNHLAFQKKGNTLSAYLNGEEVWSDNSLTLNNNDFGLSILDSFNVLLDELRISSVARYSGSFVPNTEPYSADAQPLPATSAIIDYSNERLNLLEEKTGKGVYLDSTQDMKPFYWDGTASYPLISPESAVRFPDTTAKVDITAALNAGGYQAPTSGWICAISNWAGMSDDSYLPFELMSNSIYFIKDAWAARDGRDGYGQSSAYFPVRANEYVTLTSPGPGVVLGYFMPFI